MEKLEREQVIIIFLVLSMADYPLTIREIPRHVFKLKRYSLSETPLQEAFVFFMKAYTLRTQRCASHSFFSLSRLGLFSIYYFNIHGLSLRRLLIGCKFQLSMEQEAAGACVRAACSSLFSQEGALFIHLRAALRSTAPSLRLSLALRLKLCVLRPVFVSSSRLAGGFSPSLSDQTSCCHYPPPIPCQTSIEFASKPCNTITVFDRKTCHLISTCWSTQVTAAVFKPSPNASQATRIPLHLLSTQRGAVITVQLNKFNNVSPLCIHSDSSRSKCQR